MAELLLVVAPVASLLSLKAVSRSLYSIKMQSLFIVTSVATETS
jgi:hypothetical protein